MADGLSSRLPRRARGRPFENGRSGNTAGRETGSRNNGDHRRPAALLDGESEALSRETVEFALIGDPTANRLCLERILPPIESGPTGQAPGLNADDIAAAMKAVTPALPAARSHRARR